MSNAEYVRLYYGQGLEIESVYRKGTRVSFRLPCGEHEEEITDDADFYCRR